MDNWGLIDMFSYVSIVCSVGVIYLFAHFFLYVFILRHRVLFGTEKGIFLFHFISAAMFVLASIAVFLVRCTDEVFSVACVLVAAHGIYSISFLELWSLAQGSYSLSILGRRKHKDKAIARSQLVESLSEIGGSKKVDRLAGLRGFHLVHLDAGCWKLNSSGASIAAMLRGLLWLANIRERG